MARLTLEQAAGITGGTILQGNPRLSFERYNFDSRLTRPGELFFALRGERDGHGFIADALRRGAAGAVISGKIALSGADFGVLRVRNTLQALQDLARAALAGQPVKVVGITGSVGKTSTRTFAAELLSSAFRVLESEKNFNNHIGLPMTLLRLEKEHQVAVLEMGMNAGGEILQLTRIARPEVGVITNILPVHLEFFRSLDEIAAAKKEILEGMEGRGTAVLNGDDPLVRKIAAGWPDRTLYFGLSDGHPVRASEIRKDGRKGMSFILHYGRQQAALTLPFLNRGYLFDFLAAAAVSLALSLDLDRLLSRIPRVRPLPMRGELLEMENGITLVDDSYNSSPAALESALMGLADVPASRRVAVLGDMKELGKGEADFHFQAGRQLRLSGWDVLVTVGPLAALMADGAASEGMTPDNIFRFPDAERAAEAIEGIVAGGDLVLVKGSRSVRMDKVSQILKRKGT